MTEIKIEKKATIWPWIIVGLLILAVVLYLLFFRNNNNNNTVVANTDTTALIDTHENNDTVVSYLTFIKADTTKMALDHAYTSEAIMKLVAATRAMAGEANFTIKADLDKAEDDANQITKNPMATNHANLIKDAAMHIGTALQNLQHTKYPSLNSEADAVTSAASGINPDVLTLDQKPVVQSFFDKAGDLLQKMN